MQGVASPMDAGLSSLLRLAGQNALVTGGSGAIGRAIVELLADRGARVISLDLPDRPAPERCTPLSCDLDDPASVAEAVSKVDDLAPELHLFVHCAGITEDAVLWKMSDAQWDRVMQINLTSAFQLLRGCIPMVRRAGRGSIVLISSINGERGKMGQANYAASKAGLIAVGRTLARELGRFQIRVNTVSPGLIDSPMTRSLPPEYFQKAIDESPLGRAGLPEDVARAVLFLCSEMSSHVTGQVLRVDGGQLIC